MMALSRAWWRAIRCCYGLVSAALLLVLFLRLSGAVGAPLGVDLALGEIKGAGWRAQDVHFYVQDQGGDALGIEGRVGRLELEGGLGRIENIHLTCPVLERLPGLLRCRDATARFTHPALGEQQLRLDIRYRAQGESALRFSGLRLGQGTLSGRYVGQAQQWRVAFRAQRLDAAVLQRVLSHFPLPDYGYSFTGQLGLDLQLEADALGISRVNLGLKTQAFAFSDSTGERAGEELNLLLDLNARRDDALSWQFQSHVNLLKGVVLFDARVFEVPSSPLSLQAQGLWDRRQGLLDLRQVQIDHPQVLQAEASALIALGGQPALRRAWLHIHEGRFPAFQRSYLRPWLAATDWDQLQTAGAFEAQLRFTQGQDPQLRLKLTDFSLSDGQGRLGVRGVNAHWRWGLPAQSEPCTIAWQGGHLYKLTLGAVSARLACEGKDYQLLAPLDVPFLDGVLKAQAFSLQGAATAQMRWRLDAGLTPVSMRDLTQALGWPQMTGRLSGMIPDVHYAQGHLALGGALLVRVFDGTVTVTDMWAEDLFGDAPYLHADVNFENLDSDALTRAFAFGHISGRLSGYVRQLQMRNWQPIAFDARLETSKGDRSAHRISQAAVNNLTRLGGGLSGALTGGFIGMFEEFSYDRIGIGCRLADNVCQMSGVGPAKQGFYLVKGAGLPRIDVIGFNRRVDWWVLSERLKNFDQAQGPVIK